MYCREHSSNKKCKLIGMGCKQTLAPYLSHGVIIDFGTLKGKKGEFQVRNLLKKIISN